MSKPRIKISPKTKVPPGWGLVGLICIGGLILAAFAPLYGQFLNWQLQQGPIQLQVNTLAQSHTTSCGPAAITMAHNYANPDDLVSEAMVIEYAAAEGYYTAGRTPFTSPANMVRIARHYADDVRSGHAVNSRQGLSLLIERLQVGEPVIIDVFTRLDDPESEAHFIVVTGISVDSNRQNAVVVHYNDPLSGRAESADWLGNAGIWNAWLNNKDPGGSGWWMVIGAP